MFKKRLTSFSQNIFSKIENSIQIIHPSKGCQDQREEGESQPSRDEAPVLGIRFYTEYPLCNYACEYCIAFSTKSQKRLKRWREKGKANYLSIVQALINMPYAIDVRIGVGGEFFIDKTLIDGARQLSVARNCVAVNLITNLSFPFQQYLSFLKDFALSKVAIIASYHDTQIKDKQEWLETAERMNGLVDFAIAVVAWPPILKRLAEIKKMFEERGLYVFMQAFQGLYEGKKFPESYSGEERVLLRKLFYSQHDYDYMVELKKPGLCYAGVDYVYLDIDGNIYRCGMTKMRLGNILKDHYRLLSEAKSCPMSHCPCDKENLNTKDFREHYGKTGLNQHKYVDKLSDPGRTTVVIRPSLHGVG